ncbi:hypothetical protein CALVIDRAFT_260188 [Calocera viscosa TUFC12733]|uniref:Uncharacterized protein n=1 Tax=Calocera viscosa (strain TUFC12733) TaxID=1330018 RepID=A0A167J375_CALVF|nr:hypothetical protein CALVIDRAFT_260188 [Calocera viscosa TUFC12733]
MDDAAARGEMARCCRAEIARVVDQMMHFTTHTQIYASQLRLRRRLQACRPELRTGRCFSTRRMRIHPSYTVLPAELPSRFCFLTISDSYQAVSVQRISRFWPIVKLALTEQLERLSTVAPTEGCDLPSQAISGPFIPRKPIFISAGPFLVPAMQCKPFLVPSCPTIPFPVVVCVPVGQAQETAARGTATCWLTASWSLVHLCKAVPLPAKPNPHSHRRGATQCCRCMRSG